MIFTLERIENKPMENKFINTSNIPLMLTIKETAEVTNISEWSLRKLVKENKIIYFKSGRKTFININLLTKQLNEGNLKI